MGVFEQQHCNYEHLFGQALSTPKCGPLGTPMGTEERLIW